MTKVLRILTVLFVLVALVALGASVMVQGQGAGGGQGRGGGGGGRGPAVPPILMTSTAWEDGGVIPAKFVGGMGVSPELKWSQIPMGTQSLFLLLHDPEPSLHKS